MVLDQQGGPNWFKNWCVAPVLVDPNQDALYFTPLYYVMCHFSKFIRPGFVVIQHQCADQDIMATAVKADDNRYVVVLFNPTQNLKRICIKGIDQIYRVTVKPQAIQTILINN
jgi:glucosylceramidase